MAQLQTNIGSSFLAFIYINGWSFILYWNSHYIVTAIVKMMVLNQTVVILEIKWNIGILLNNDYWRHLQKPLFNVLMQVCIYFVIFVYTFTDFSVGKTKINDPATHSSADSIWIQPRVDVTCSLGWETMWDVGSKSLICPVKANSSDCLLFK